MLYKDVDDFLLIYKSGCNYLTSNVRSHCTQVCTSDLKESEQYLIDLNSKISLKESEQYLIDLNSKIYLKESEQYLIDLNSKIYFLDEQSKV